MRGTFDYVPLTTLFPHLQKAIAAGGVEPKLLALVHLRASQINGCSACVYDSVAGGGGR
ncbi:hypothetical protein GCM10010310_63910 [Streptomyces violaceolatus]|uniref:Carboxymuconolactone decarboxylase-like domain-containing protein n=1 Tax=Streptomyces violaceolatus TaxID=67378 RepID=A0ABN3TCY1_9ACTN